MGFWYNISCNLQPWDIMVLVKYLTKCATNQIIQNNQIKKINQVKLAHHQTEFRSCLSGADDVAKHKLQAIVLQLVRRHPVLSPVKYETNPILHQGGEGLDHDGGSHGGDEGHSHRWRAFKYPCTNWRSHTHGVFLFSDRNIPLITKFLNRNMSDKYSEVDLTS